MRLLIFCTAFILAYFLPLKQAPAQTPVFAIRNGVPSFLRTGDRLELKLTIRNQSGKERTGQAELQLTDAATGISIDGWFQNVFPNQYFTAGASDSTVVSFPIEVPYQFYKTAAWRFVVRAGTDTASVKGSFPVITQTPPSQLAFVTQKTGSHHFIQLQQSAKMEGIQHAGLQWTVAATPAAFAYAALPALYQASSFPTLTLANKFFAAAVQWQLASTAPQIALLMAKEQGSVVPELNFANSTDLLQEVNKLAASIKNQQQRNGGIGLWPGGEANSDATAYVALTIGRLLQLKALPPDLHASLTSVGEKALGFLKKEQKNIPPVITAYIGRLLQPEKQKNKTALKGVTDITSGSYAEIAFAAATLASNQAIAEAQKLLQMQVSAANANKDKPGLWQHTVLAESLFLEAAVLLNNNTGLRDSLSRSLIQQMQGNAWATPEVSAAAIFALLQAWGNTPQTLPQAAVQLGKMPPQTITQGAYLTSGSIEAGRVNPGLADVHIRTEANSPVWTKLQWQFYVEPNEAVDTPVRVSKEWKLVKNGQTTPLTSGLFIQAGDELEVTLVLTLDQLTKDLLLTDGWPAGMMPLANSQQIAPAKPTVWQQTQPAQQQWWIKSLPAGVHRFSYRLKAIYPGSFFSGAVVLRDAFSEKEINTLAGEKIMIE